MKQLNIKAITEVKDILNKYKNTEVKGYCKAYIEFGNVEDFEYNIENKKLSIFAYGKAYGDSFNNIKKITEKDWNNFNKTSKWIIDFAGNYCPYTTNEHGAVKIAKLLNERNIDIKDIELIIYND